MSQKLLTKILQKVKIELGDEFDRNFERKAFFDQPWQPRRRQGKGSILMIRGRLRRSIRARISKNSILFSSDSEYADIHNAGGTIQVTPRMRKFFWAMYYKNQQGLYMSIKTKGYKTKTNIKKSATAEIWKAMALAKKITIPKRQFLGTHPRVTETVTKVANDCTKEYLNQMFNDFKNKLK